MRQHQLRTSSFDIEAFDNATMGRRFIDNIVKYGGEEGSYAFFVGNMTAETHMERYKCGYRIPERELSESEASE